MAKFVKICNDRINVNEVIAYGIGEGVRYFVKTAGMVEVNESYFDSAFTDYNAGWKDSEDILSERPMHAEDGMPVRINGEVVRYGCLTVSEYVVEKSKYLYVESKLTDGKILTKKYFPDENFDIDEKIKELDAIFCK